MSFAETRAALSQLTWHLAPDWDPGMVTFLKQYYWRLVPFWPEDRRFLPPGDRRLEESVLQRLPGTAQLEVSQAREHVVSGAALANISLEATTRQCILLVLAFSKLGGLDRGSLSAGDPGEPLMAIWRAGYQIKYSDAGIEFVYDSGWQTMRVPSRDAVRAYGQEPVSRA